MKSLHQNKFQTGRVEPLNSTVCAHTWLMMPMFRGKKTTLCLFLILSLHLDVVPGIRLRQAGLFIQQPYKRNHVTTPQKKKKKSK